eukprot:6083789-Amphidinium_carterae.2
MVPFLVDPDTHSHFLRSATRASLLFVQSWTPVDLLGSLTGAKYMGGAGIRHYAKDSESNEGLCRTELEAILKCCKPGQVLQSDFRICITLHLPAVDLRCKEQKDEFSKLRADADTARLHQLHYR